MKRLKWETLTFIALGAFPSKNGPTRERIDKAIAAKDYDQLVGILREWMDIDDTIKLYGEEK